MNEELNLDVTVVVVFYSNFNFLKATVRGERHPKSKSGDKIKISKPCPCPPLALLGLDLIGILNWVAGSFRVFLPGAS